MISSLPQGFRAIHRKALLAVPSNEWWQLLVGLREVSTSKKILLCCMLLKENIDFWEENLNHDIDKSAFDELKRCINEKASELQEATLTKDSEKVSFVVAGYVAKKLKEKSKCNTCKELLTGTDVGNDLSYFQLLSRGVLTAPSVALHDYICNGFAILDVLSDILQRLFAISIRGGLFALHTYCEDATFTCDSHGERGKRSASETLVNIFFNNKQKIVNDSVRKEAVTVFKKRQRFNQ